MPANKYALLRYRIIDKSLRNKYKPYPTREQLRQACEDQLYNSLSERVSLSTIDKDLKAMREDETLGYLAPIAFSKLNGGYFYTDENYSIDSIPLNEDDISAIRVAVQTLHQFKQVKIFESFDFAIGKIFDRINLAEKVDDEAINRFIQFESVTEMRGSEYLPQLLKAIKSKNTIEIEYKNFVSNVSKQHVLQPYLLKEYRNRWYLIAFEPIVKKFKTFGLDRVLALNLSTNTFTYNKNFNPDIFFKHSIGITSDQTKPQEVKLAFTPIQGNFVKSQPLHPTQKIVTETKTQTVISLEVLITYELQQLILGYGSSVKVLKPNSLKTNITNSLKQALNQYLK